MYNALLELSEISKHDNNKPNGFVVSEPFDIGIFHYLSIVSIRDEILRPATVSRPHLGDLRSHSLTRLLVIIQSMLPFVATILNTVIKFHFLASIIFTTKDSKYHKEEKKVFFCFLVTFVTQGYDIVK